MRGTCVGESRNSCGPTPKEGPREIDDLADRAARFHRDQNMLLINGDFRVFVDMESSWVEKLKAGGVPNPCAVVKEVVRASASHTHLRAHETLRHLVCRPLLEKKKKKKHVSLGTPLLSV